MSDRDKCVAFDFYNTLAHVDWAEHRRLVASKIGVPNPQLRIALKATHDARMTGKYGSSYGDWRAVIKACDLDNSTDLISSIVTAERDFLTRSMSWYLDVMPVLRDLRNRGITLGVISNCYFATRDLIAKSDLRDLVDAVILSCETGYQKPMPEIYLKAANQLGRDPDGILYVDDDEDACEGARRVGMHVLRIVRGKDPKSNSANSLDLIDHLEAADLLSRLGELHRISIIRKDMNLVEPLATYYLKHFRELLILLADYRFRHFMRDALSVPLNAGLVAGIKDDCNRRCLCTCGQLQESSAEPRIQRRGINDRWPVEA